MWILTLTPSPCSRWVVNNMLFLLLLFLLNWIVFISPGRIEHLEFDDCKPLLSFFNLFLDSIYVNKSSLTFISFQFLIPLDHSWFLPQRSKILNNYIFKSSFFLQWLFRTCGVRLLAWYPTSIKDHSLPFYFSRVGWLNE